MMRRYILAGVAVTFAVILADGAWALYACKGADGQTRYVSAPEQCQTGYRKLPTYDKKSNSGKTSTPPRSGSSGLAPAPSGTRLPPVSSRTQSALDQKRGAVLLYELRSERRVKDALDKLIAETDITDDRLSVVKKQLGEHERNIAAIRRELARLGYNTP